LNRPRLVAIVERIELNSRRIKKVILGAGAFALAAPVGGLSFASAQHNLHHGYGARWSPNGKRLAFVSPRGRRGQPLEVINPNGTGLVNLTGKWFVAQAPVWSPRGAKLAFIRMTRVSRQKETSSLWTIGTATRVKKRLAVSAVRFDLDSELAWSPNGSRIALSRLDEAVRDYRIYTVKANGGGLRLLTRGRRPDWSPDGRTIVFDTTGTGFDPGVGVVNADGTDARLLANSGTQPRFSPDGTQIVFKRGGEIWTMNADGSDQTQLTQGSEFDFGPVWSPNGRMIAFGRGASKPQIYVMNIDGSDQRRLAPSRTPERDADWSPDGKRISFERCTSGFRTCDVSIANVG
jgi:Tol biopolymer transport system component